jgi:hypothetical protein
MLTSHGLSSINLPPHFDVLLGEAPVLRQTWVQHKRTSNIYVMEVGRRYWRALIVFLANIENPILKPVAFELDRSRLACFPRLSFPRYFERAPSSNTEPGVLKPKPKARLLVRNSEPEN